MKKILLSFGLLCAAFVVQAQSFVDNDKGMIWQFETRSLFSSKNDGVQQRIIDGELAVGYRFDPRFSLLCRLRGRWGCLRVRVRKATRMRCNSEWDSAMRRCMPTTTGSTFRSGSGNTLGATGTSVITMSGVRWQSDVLWAPLFVGAGVRYIDAYKSGFADYCHAYLTVGVRILWRCRSDHCGALTDYHFPFRNRGSAGPFLPTLCRGEIFFALKSARKGPENDSYRENIAHARAIFPGKVARIARNYYFCSLFGGPH